MLLTIDVGNTNITCGVFWGSDLKTTFRLTTTVARTSDEYGMNILGILKEKGIDKKEIHDVIIASVVPQIMYSLVNSIKKYFDQNPMVVGKGTKTGIRILGGTADEYGADRIVDAVAGLSIYGGPVLIIDYGTATTYDLIDRDGSFLAGITCPGIKLAANALWSGAAKLPEIEIAKPKTALARDTIVSMQAGVFFGAIGETEYIVRKVLEEAKFAREDVKIIATGGIGRLIEKETDCIDQYDPQLTLYGLREIHEKNKH